MSAHLYLVVEHVYPEVGLNNLALKTHGGWEAFIKRKIKDLDVIIVQQGLYICTFSYFFLFLKHKFLIFVHKLITNGTVIYVLHEIVDLIPIGFYFGLI